MTDDYDPIWLGGWGLTPSEQSKQKDEIEKAFKSIRGEQPENQTEFDFGADDFEWM